MPPCPTCSFTREIAVNISRRVISKGWSHMPSGIYRRGFAVSFTCHSAFAEGAQQFPAPKHEALTLLHKTSKLVPSVLEFMRTSGFARTRESVDVWDHVLSEAHEDLSATTERPIKITVYGLDEWSGAEELVTALLADPLSSDKARNQALTQRWNNTSEQKLDISYGADLNAGPLSLQLPSPYLSQFSVPIEFTELRSPSAQSLKPVSLLEILETPAILEADIPILVCNPLVTPLATILSAQLPTNTIVVLSSSLPQEDLDSIAQQQRPHSTSFHHHHVPKTIQLAAADPKRAAKAVQILQNDPNSLSAIQKFQDDFIGSHLATVTKALQDKLVQHDSTAQLTTIRAKMAMAHTNDAVSASFASIHKVRHQLDQAFIDTSDLRERIEEIQARVESDVFARPRDSEDGKEPRNEVRDALKQAQKEMSQVMDRLTWWRMIWRVDEISSIVSAAITRTWCHGLEKKLILHTGRLSVTQHNVSHSALALLSKHPVISSAVLRNSLLQLKSSPNYGLTPGSLTQSLYSRRNQLIEYPTTRLHVAGQRAVLGMTGGVVSGIGMSWAGWLGWLLGSGEGLLGFIGIDAGTAIGVGVLSSVASIRWGVGKWEKAKKRWWQDWERVGDGLDRDLKATLHRAMRQQVVIVPETACDGMSKLIQEREEELAKVGEELEEVQTGLDDVMDKVETKS